MAPSSRFDLALILGGVLRPETSVRENKCRNNPGRTASLIESYLEFV
jgi:hypothetical protein